LVDTKNLGEQAEQEFMSFLPNDDNRKFTELYGVHPTEIKLYSRRQPSLYQHHSTILFILKGQDLEESAEEENPNEKWATQRTYAPIYNEKLPLEFFDFIVIDECHRSIYNLWMQVLDYFDAFQVGLTATPDNRTIGYFNQNIVSEYTHEQAVADGVNVGYDVYLIETKITQQGVNSLER
jgi:type I restriction enzyme R subunit